MAHAVNFLHNTEPESVHTRHRRKRRWRWVWVSVLFVFFVWVMAVMVAAGQVLAASLDGRDALFEARDAALAMQFDRAQDQLERADRSFAQAERGFFVLQSVQFIPWVDTQIDAVGHIITSGRSVSQTLLEVVDLGAELMRIAGLAQEDVAGITQGEAPEITFDRLSPETKRSVLQRLHHAAPDLELINAKIAVARDELQRLPQGEVVGPIRNALVPLEQRLGELQESVQVLSLAAYMLPEFAGLDEERAFLLLFLNNAELRPGGGFIGTYGVLRMRDGEIQNLRTQDVYRLDDAAAPTLDTVPPDPLAQYNATSKWFFRDANWSPDFAISSQRAIELFLQEVETLPPAVREQVQPRVVPGGVVGFTPDYASDLLEVTGPIDVQGQTFTAANIFDTLEYQVEFGFAEQGIPPEQRKEILSQLVLEMKDRLFALPLSEWARVVDATKEALRTKQFLLYSQDAKAQRVVEQAGWGGRVEPGSIDTQLWVDANLASLKSDPAVERTITYEIFQNTSGEYIGRTTMHYNHTGTFDWKTTRYRTYARLYVPAGSEFIRVRGSLRNDPTQNPTGAPGAPDVYQELGLNVFGAFTSIEPGQQHDLLFEYKLADTVVEAIREGRYQLRTMKQAGAQPHTLTLNLDFGKNITHAKPAESADEWGDVIYRLNTILDQDKTFEIDL